MVYTIDGIIVYNSEDSTLSHIPTQETLSLSISSGRLLERLLDSHGEILSRDTLLTEVWDKYGLRGSNSNLNQYLSMLRRALAGFGCENLIITVPKMGIRLNTAVPVERERVTPLIIAESETRLRKDADTEARHVSPIAREEISGITSDASAPPAGPAHWLLLALLFVILLGVTGWSYVNIHQRNEDFTPATLLLKGGCQAVIMQGIDNSEKAMLEKQILQMLQENHQLCDADTRIYFDRNTAFTTQNYGRTILSSCKTNSSGHVISCSNFYYLDWRMN
ncbi:transcriptional regulator [Pantoea sp. KPR_PJ]|uniref:winged helix-turn-helix domain-containing protein n=1 Tax=Pantoea sp. KPR_PJ TaxID=2738375 RepID=UPI0035270AC9